ESDLEIAAELVHAEEKDVRGRSQWGPQEMADFWRRGDFDGGAWIAETSDRVPVGFAVSMHRDDRTDCGATVHPKFRSRGLSAALLAKSEERARERGSQTLTAGMLAENESARTLLEQLGFREARHFYHMRIVFDRAPRAPAWSPGIQPATFRREDARA